MFVNLFGLLSLNAQWVTYKIVNSGHSINFPSEPESISSPNTSMFVFQSNIGSLIYEVRYIAYNNSGGEVSELEINNRLEKAIDDYNKHTNSSTVQKSDMFVWKEGHSKTAKSEGPNNLKANLRAYYVGFKLFLITVSNRPDYPHPRHVTNFVNTFQQIEQ